MRFAIGGKAFERVNKPDIQFKGHGPMIGKDLWGVDLATYV